MKIDFIIFAINCINKTSYIRQTLVRIATNRCKIIIGTVKILKKAGRVI